MKQKLVYALFLAGLLASCNSEEEMIKSNPEYVAPGQGVLHISLSDAAANTRAVGDTLTGLATTEEKTISSVAFFVKTEAEGTKGGNFMKYFSDLSAGTDGAFQNPLTEVSSGEYTCMIQHVSDGWGNPEVIVIANYMENGLENRLKNISDWNELSNFQTEVLNTQNPVTPLLMFSQKSIDAWKTAPGSVNGGGTATVTFNMERLVSRIDVHNLAYNSVDADKGFVLESAQLIRPRTSSYLIPGATGGTAPVVSADPFQALTNVELDAATQTYQQIDTLYAYENANDNKATAIRINGKFFGTQVSKTIEFKKPDAVTPIALARNHRYVVNINPTPDSTDIAFDIVVKKWNEADTIKVNPVYPAPVVDWASVVFDAGGGENTWNAGTKTLVLNDPNGSITLKAKGLNVSAIEVGTKFAYDTKGVSIDRAKISSAITTTYVSPYSGEIETTHKITFGDYQNEVKVPVDFYLCVSNSGNKLNRKDSIKVQLRPNYTDDRYGAVNEKPVLVGGKYWAPVNVGATSLTYSETIASMGYFYQWGRNQTNMSVENAGKVQGPLSYEESKNHLTKHIMGVIGSNYDWLNPSDPYFNTRNSLWSESVNDSPCPKGWRVPNLSELQTIGAKFDKTITNNRVEITGDESGKKLYLPATGNLSASSGNHSGKGLQVRLWSSTINDVKSHLLFLESGNVASTNEDWRANSIAIRCIQE